MGGRAAELYEEDFYAWTQEQAAVLRAEFRGDNRLDVEHLAEEIEDLGRAELLAVESYVEQIIAHLLKLDYSGLDWPRAGWRREVVAFRVSMHRKLTPSMKRRVQRKLPTLYERGARLAGASLHDSEPGFLRRLPKASPYDWAAVESREVLAELERSEGPDRGGA
jgi:hypothetical protein